MEARMVTRCAPGATLAAPYTRRCSAPPFPTAAACGKNRRMPIHVYHYPKCSTCRKARKWLQDHQLAHSESDLVATPISLAKLRDLHKRSGLPLARFLNTSGESYRAGNFKERIKTLSESEVLSALSKDGKLVKRPIVDAGDVVLVGFDEAAYARELAH
jgi:arsenate reductase (glutaredoxin)